MAEHLICNQAVDGSTPFTSSNMGEFPSGQRGQTVNLLASLSVVRIHLPPPRKKPIAYAIGFFQWCLPVTQMMTATPNDVRFANDAWLRHILWQTSHHCGTKWSNIIFAKQMHHIAIGDASFDKWSNSFRCIFSRSYPNLRTFCSQYRKKAYCLRNRLFSMMFAFGKWWRLKPMMTLTPSDVCLRAHRGKHRIIAKRSEATSFWAKRKTSYRCKTVHHLTSERFYGIISLY